LSVPLRASRRGLPTFRSLRSRTRAPRMGSWRATTSLRWGLEGQEPEGQERAKHAQRQGEGGGPHPDGKKPQASRPEAVLEDCGWAACPRGASHPLAAADGRPPAPSARKYRKALRRVGKASRRCRKSPTLSPGNDARECSMRIARTLIAVLL